MGFDRGNRTYWVFYFVTFILVEPHDKESQWETITDSDQIQDLIDCLDDRGQMEHRLKTSLTDEMDGIKQIFKEREKYDEDQTETIQTRGVRKSKFSIRSKIEKYDSFFQ